MVFARYSLTPTELRIFVLLLSMIKKSDTQFKTYQIPVDFFYEPGRGSGYQAIIEAQTRLASRVIEFYDKEKRRWISRPLMGECSYTSGEAYVQCAFNTYMVPYLLQLKGNFTLSKRNHLEPLSSQYYAFRIYQILRSKIKYGGCTLTIETLRHLFHLENKYSQWTDFKKRVLDVAQERLRETDIQFEYAANRVGRSVKTVDFIITSEPELIQLDVFEEAEDLTPDQERAKEILAAWGFSKTQTRNLLQAPVRSITKVSYDLTLQNINAGQQPKARAGWAYNEFVRRLGLGN